MFDFYTLHRVDKTFCEWDKVKGKIRSGIAIEDKAIFYLRRDGIFITDKDYRGMGTYKIVDDLIICMRERPCFYV